MAKPDELSFFEFTSIYSKLIQLSETWSDLWAMLYYQQTSVGKVINLMYSDVCSYKGVITGNFHKANPPLYLNAGALKIVKKRRILYPNDIYIFQSHSNRVKAIVKPVTVIAFNQALRKAAEHLPYKNVSSNSARRVKLYDIEVG
ncbi:hypothetical protein [Kosakonia pseudosacchari]|uniref:hypothetical protein n=1 Tax=Kosakonia pseudosacchari TaxID=1646340 RepID=UPI000A3B9EE8|nr:hypothetical protein [Kosakonia pseudosacchari]